MATDAFTCSRCGQVSFYRDGSYLFGEQILCARCYAAQAALTAPVAGQAPPGAPPAGYPAPVMGYPGGPPPYGQQPLRANVCGIIGLICGLAAVACVVVFVVSASSRWDDLRKLMEEVQKNPSDQTGNSKKMEKWANQYQKEAVGMTLGCCGGIVFVFVGLILSIVGVCLSNVRKGLAVAGLVLNGLVLLLPCLLTCALGGA